jgi:hypothetical protein
MPPEHTASGVDRAAVAIRGETTGGGGRRASTASIFVEWLKVAVIGLI